MLRAPRHNCSTILGSVTTVTFVSRRPLPARVDVADLALRVRQCVSRNVCCWHIASFAACPLFGRYRRHSGQKSARALNGSVANDPKQSSGPDDSRLSRRLPVLSVFLTPPP